MEKYNQNLATTIIEEYYRIYPFLNQAILNYVLSLADSGMKKDLQDKECYVSFVDVPTRHKVRELTTAKIGTLIRISGQIVRTHPVHPELVLGTFVCLDCQTVIKNVEQQFKVSITVIVLICIRYPINSSPNKKWQETKSCPMRKVKKNLVKFLQFSRYSNFHELKNCKVKYLKC